jgi:hypothetical protein
MWAGVVYPKAVTFLVARPCFVVAPWRHADDDDVVRLFSSHHVVARRRNCVATRQLGLLRVSRFAGCGLPTDALFHNVPWRERLPRASSGCCACASERASHGCGAHCIARSRSAVGQAHFARHVGHGARRGADGAERLSAGGRVRGVRGWLRTWHVRKLHGCLDGRRRFQPGRQCGPARAARPRSCRARRRGSHCCTVPHTASAHTSRPSDVVRPAHGGGCDGGGRVGGRRCFTFSRTGRL